MSIDPQLFMPTIEGEDHYYLVWTSQIAKVMSEFIALPSEKDGAIKTEPPEVEQISCEVPAIYMLKLMDESDDSAEGIGQVLEAVQRQTGLDPEEFSARLQPMDGDLATIMNFNTVRDIRSPSSYSEHGLNNIVFQLGASHTLWNISQTILTAHMGDPSNENDLGAWQLFEALGISHEKVLQKKDFTLMIQQLEQLHKATLFHCLRVIMKTDKEAVSIEPRTIPTAEWNAIIRECYERFCSPKAREEASKMKSPKLNNILLRLQEFSTVIEANNAMKAGDIGRLINVWKIWSVMAQGLKGLTHYSSYLPRMVLLLTQILPPDLAKLLRHNLLFSPSGRPGHFVAKDFFLENQNYWLKFFYNRGGIGTEVQRLKNLFSMNIVLVRSQSHASQLSVPQRAYNGYFGQLRAMFHSMQIDSGKKRIHQSKKTTLTLQSLQMFCRIANTKDILDVDQKNIGSNKLKTDDSYKQGLKKFASEIRTKDQHLGRMRLHFPKPSNEEEAIINNEEEPTLEQDM
ncbi:hypothetical protein PGTUg99_028084 [Puccinia graminis f. sp. tritici]|uniref:DUF6589 domain-containing protein n=1 Tax=Puccinia graminis f. sp. tritici TaxID=56615 RepID=A0A5B0P2G0_PUCGR|nr:hypothetical protein PGTUg99_028084 [Puccinia graminis f. sp. tritici]